eukprot:gene21001-23052_t
MSGEFSGVQKQIQEQFPFAYYNHCVAHRMALCASQSANKIPKVAEFFGILDKLISFFRSSPKRTAHLGQNLPKPGDTRWVSRNTSVSVIDTCYETIGTVLYEIAHDNSQKKDTQESAKGIFLQIQQIDFIFFLKLYRKLFEHCTPIVTIMQKPSFDAVQLSSMLDDFHEALLLPVVRTRGGWRGVEHSADGSSDSWKTFLVNVASTVAKTYSEQLQWRFENVKKFKWVDLVHPARFSQRKSASSGDQRALISKLSEVYPFVVPDPMALEHNLSVLYHNEEISVLLQKLVRERDALVAKKQERRRRLAQEREDPEELDTFPLAEDDIEVEQVKEGNPSLQDLLALLRKAELEEALLEAVHLAPLAVTTPLTSVYCERVFSRMKRVISPARTTMLQQRKEMLVFLQVEHKILRHLASKQSFKESIVNRFKSYNRRRFERFSRR